MAGFRQSAFAQIVLPAIVWFACAGAAVHIVTSERFVDHIAWLEIREDLTLDLFEWVISPRYPTGAPDGN